jgi:hypothetical protein
MRVSVLGKIPLGQFALTNDVAGDHLSCVGCGANGHRNDSGR